jgi:hypothetical protein
MLQGLRTTIYRGCTETAQEGAFRAIWSSRLSISRIIANIVGDMNKARAWYAQVLNTQPYFDEAGTSDSTLAAINWD